MNLEIDIQKEGKLINQPGYTEVQKHHVKKHITADPLNLTISFQYSTFPGT
jgi:hypothetical protein